jgi:hypothetical protein
MTIKKQFVDLVKLLEDNKGKKVSTIMPDILDLVSSQKRDKTVLKDDEGNLIAIFCYYHKQWELLCDVEYGVKASRPSGYNTMCKIGVSKWTKQQSVAKKANERVLNDVSEGKILPSDIKVQMKTIEDDRKTISDVDRPKGFETEEILFGAVS